MNPRSAADILASATFAPTKKSRKPAKANPLTSDLGFSKFSSTTVASSSVSQPARDTNPLTTADPYMPPTSFKFISTSTPDTFSTPREEEAVGGHFDELVFINSYMFF
jgi:hypothetical protein